MPDWTKSMQQTFEYYVVDPNTWKDKTPKIHFSSPKSKLKKEFRSHHDYIDSNSFIDFIELVC